MSRARWIDRVHGLLLNTACKRAWGESLDLCDPSDLVDQLRPAIADAIKTVDNREVMASMMLDLYRRYNGPGPETGTGSQCMH